MHRNQQDEISASPKNRKQRGGRNRQPYPSASDLSAARQERISHPFGSERRENALPLSSANAGIDEVELKKLFDNVQRIIQEDEKKTILAIQSQPIILSDSKNEMTSASPISSELFERKEVSTLAAIQGSLFLRRTDSGGWVGARSESDDYHFPLDQHKNSAFRYALERTNTIPSLASPASGGAVQAQIDRLGKLAPIKEKDYWFQSTPESTALMTTFMRRLFSDDRRIRKILESHYNKVKKIKPKAGQTFPTALAPSCIGFAAVENKRTNKQYLIISTSLNKFIHPVRDLIDDLATRMTEENVSRGSNLSYIFVKENVSRPLRDTRELSGVEDRPCSEVGLFLKLSSMFAEQGDALQILGGHAAYLYPFKDNQTYGRESRNSDNQLVSGRIREETHGEWLNLNVDGFQLKTIKCCELCQSKKIHWSGAFRDAQAYSANSAERGFDSFVRDLIRWHAEMDSPSVSASFSLNTSISTTQSVTSSLASSSAHSAASVSNPQPSPFATPVMSHTTLPHIGIPSLVARPPISPESSSTGMEASSSGSWNYMVTTRVSSSREPNAFIETQTRMAATWAACSESIGIPTMPPFPMPMMPSVIPSHMMMPSIPQASARSIPPPPSSHPLFSSSSLFGGSVVNEEAKEYSLAPRLEWRRS